jgi:hypothetical protein
MSSKTSKNGCLIIIAGFLIIFFYLKSKAKRLDEINFSLAIPSNIRVDEVIALDYLPELGLPGDNSCGGAVFKLSERTVKDIEDKGLSFFSDKKSKGSLSQHPFHGGRNYNSWKKTPWEAMPALAKYDRSLDRPSSSLGCLGEIDHQIIEKIKSSIKEKGSYYTQEKDSVKVYDLIVIPELEVVVYSFEE